MASIRIKMRVAKPKLLDEMRGFMRTAEFSQRNRNWFWQHLGVGLLALLSFAFAPCEAQDAGPKKLSKMVRFDDCEFVPTEYADGDSFRVRVPNGEFVFRLYYVDAPEADERFPDRNAEQARYFGITPAESVASGKAAAEFNRETFKGKKLTVYTRWATALGSSRQSRYYAIVEVDGRGLAELMVEAGFARLHGVSTNHPDGRKAPEYMAVLREMEVEARAQKRGAWANSRPELEHPTVVETAEVVERSPWVERAAFAGGGAGLAGLGWLLSRGRRHPINGR